MNRNLHAIAITAILAISPIVSQAKLFKTTQRGKMYDYDPGPSKSSKWPDLFAETPNYRAFGKAVLGGRGEKFRWKMGPMHYRGRLTPNSVKVFVIGQEGAQDENVSNRSFTGSTGTRMQKFLNYLGIQTSYLYMNTFVYTITGQYTTDKGVPPRVKWLAQDKDSVIVKHRHEMFDYMLEQNKGKLALVIGVGSAGKDSAVTWAKSHGVDCDKSKIGRGYCEATSGPLKGVRFIGVRHPGGASARNGGASAAGGIVADFRAKANIVSNIIKNNSSWLPADTDGKRNFSKQFQYGHGQIPHKDFSFGMNWRMGHSGTTSNRRGADKIQVFSKNGCYNNAAREGRRCSQTKVDRLGYNDPKDLLGKRPAEMDSVDIPYEAPRGSKKKDYDYGPGPIASDLMKFAVRDWEVMGVNQHPTFGPNGIYRGRLEKAKLLIIADQQSNTDFFSGRALTGEAGQKLQSFLKNLGMNESYAIIRTLPVDTIDMTEAQQIKVATQSSVEEARISIINKIIAKSDTQVVISLGNAAKKVLEGIVLDDVKTFHLNAPKSTSHVRQWKSTLNAIKKSKALTPDVKAVGTYTGKLSIIPRKDLPYGTRWWMATSGDHGAKAYRTVGGKKVFSGDYYKVYAPSWSNKSKATVDQLNTTEKSSVSKFNKLDMDHDLK